MPAVFEYPLAVEPAEVDPLGHANNVAYLQWMQAAAVAHSAVQGWPAQRYRQLGCGWVVRSHTIHYHQPARAGDRIVVRTWVATMKKVTSLRRYQILRQSDGLLLASAETKWAFINYATGQPTRIPRQITEAFPLVDQ